MCISVCSSKKKGRKKKTAVESVENIPKKLFGKNISSVICEVPTGIFTVVKPWRVHILRLGTKITRQW